MSNPSDPYDKPPKPKPSSEAVDELIQVMRTCSLAKIRAELELTLRKSPVKFAAIVSFYNAAARRKG